MSTEAANVLLTVAFITELFGVVLDNTWVVAGACVMVVAIVAGWLAWPDEE